MNAIIILFFVRIVLPVCILIALGEWIKRHEAGYWLRM